MRALKTIVTALGLVLLGAMGLLIYGLSQNWHRATQAPAAVTRPASPTPPLAGGGWGRIELGDSPGWRVESIAPAGDLVAVHLRGERGDRVVIVDPRSGTVAGTFTAGETAP